MVNVVEIYAAIKSFLESTLGNHSHFCCVYGSYPAGSITSRSDIDLFIAKEASTEEDFALISDFITELHKLHGMLQDEEVPYENKLLVSYADVDAAISLKPFKGANGGFRIPPILKTKEFLSSTDVRYRLIFNALTSPHEYVSGDLPRYLQCREIAEQNLHSLAMALAKRESPHVEDLISVLLRDSDGNEGEMYLGYKDLCTVRGYLQFVLGRHHD